jgi:hypothetical protein
MIIEGISLYFLYKNTNKVGFIAGLVFSIILLIIALFLSYKSKDIKEIGISLLFPIPYIIYSLTMKKNSCSKENNKFG